MSSSFPFVFHLALNYTEGTGRGRGYWLNCCTLFTLLSSVVLLIPLSWVTTDRARWIKATLWMACWLLVQLELTLCYNLTCGRFAPWQQASSGGLSKFRVTRNRNLSKSISYYQVVLREMLKQMQFLVPETSCLIGNTFCYRNSPSANYWQCCLEQHRQKRVEADTGRTYYMGLWLSLTGGRV